MVGEFTGPPKSTQDINTEEARDLIRKATERLEKTREAADRHVEEGYISPEVAKPGESYPPR